MNYKVLIADEAMADIFGLVQYIPQNCAIRMLPRVYVLRVIKDLMDWKKILDRTKIYHFSGDNK